jgi:hypothetical protein
MVEETQVLKHFVGQDGVYISFLEEGTEPEGALVVRCAPMNSADQLWRAGQWQWQMHYYRDESGAFMGGYAGPDKPTDWIEGPLAPSDASDLWIDGAWASRPEE